MYKKYEKNGLMVKLTNQKCINYLRKRPETNSSIVESALLRRFNLPEREKRTSSGGRKKNPKSFTRAFPIKISDQRIINEILALRENGVIQRHTVETALLDMIEKEGA